MAIAGTVGVVEFEGTIQGSLFRPERLPRTVPGSLSGRTLHAVFMKHAEDLRVE